MDYLDSSYISGVNPGNIGNLNQRQLQGLASLSPQSGLGLTPSFRPMQLDPFANLPTPQFSKDANKYFNFASNTVQHDIANPHYDSHKNLVMPNEDPKWDGQRPNDLVLPGKEKPYFDPNYPAESMLAMKKWLSPQIEAGVAPAMNARGIGYSGVSQYANENAQNYLNQIAPNVTDKNAMALDFQRLYGPSVANSLIKGFHYDPKTQMDKQGFNPFFSGSYTSLPFDVAPTLPGASEFGEGKGSAMASLVTNPNFSLDTPVPTPPPGWKPPAKQPGQGKYGFTDPQDYYETDGSLRPGWTYQGGTDPLKPQFGLFDWNQGNFYNTPGYFYDPNHMPDASRMPWLANATSPTSQTSGTS